jgi:fatty-acid desaturase
MTKPLLVFTKNYVPLLALIILLYNLAHRASSSLFFLCISSSAWRIFANHAGGHRYFAHKSFRAPNWLIIIFAWTICSTEIGVFFYWCFFHNLHHLHCDRGNDIHSPHRFGFWAVQLGLLEHEKLKYFEREEEFREKLAVRYSADLSWITLRRSVLILLLENVLWIVLSCFLSRPPFELFLWGALIPRLYTKNAIALTNSASHMFGVRPYTGLNTRLPDCQATNCWWASLLNGGEGWHSNHHAFALSARHGLLWWELDTVWLTLLLLGYLGIVTDINTVDDSIRLLPRLLENKDDPSVEPLLHHIPDRKYICLFPSSSSPTCHLVSSNKDSLREEK